MTSTGTGAATPPPSAAPGLERRLGTAALAAWLAVAVLVALASINDPDLGFHIAWGRILGDHFHEAKAITLGQDPSVTVYAYSYWLYQRLVAVLYDHLGPWSLVLLRLALVVGTLGIGVLAARRLGAGAAACAVLLAAGILIAHERFVDRPDVLSHLLWMAALWILLFHRHRRGVWLLVPLELLWVNTHVYFSLLPLLVAAFALGDRIDGRRQLRRAGMVLGALVLVSMANPAGPGAWGAQLKMMGLAAGQAFPVPIQEMISPYATHRPFFSTWVFRFAMPICVALGVAARRRIGTGALLTLLFAAALGAFAQRAVSLFAVTAIALVPAALDGVIGRTPVRSSRVLRWGPPVLVLLLGLAGVTGLLNGRILLWQDKPLRVPDLGPPRMTALGAARFLRTENVQGPVFHTPVSAGPILLENGTRLTPFMDARWLPTRPACALFLQLSAATDSTAAGLWAQAESAYGFEAVLVDPYEMPALLHHLALDPAWPLVYYDDGAAVFCRQGGRNAAVIARCGPVLEARWARTDTLREAALGAEVLRFLGSRPPSLLARLSFPWDSFGRANFALQVRSRTEAQVAYLDLFRRQHGSLHASRHRRDILGNTLWCLGESRQWEARAALCAALIGSDRTTRGRRLQLRILRAEALLHLARAAEVEPDLRPIAEDPGSGADLRAWAWEVIASAREAEGDDAGALQALAACRSLGAAGPAVEARTAELKRRVGS